MNGYLLRDAAHLKAFAAKNWLYQLRNGFYLRLINETGLRRSLRVWQNCRLLCSGAMHVSLRSFCQV